MVTSNAGKAAEVAAFFGGLLEVDHVALEVPEHRSNDIAEIARGKARYAYSQLNTPLIVDDTGFFIDALDGFPGPYAAYVLNSIGNAGILKLMEGISDRNARFTTGIAYADERGIEVFTGTLEGKITSVPGGTTDSGTIRSSRLVKRRLPRSPSMRRAGSPTVPGHSPPSMTGLLHSGVKTADNANG